MVKAKKSLLLALVMILVVVMGISLAACNGKHVDSESYTVKFMVKENGIGEWKEVHSAQSNNGVVVLPKEPVIPGYSFRAWYTDEACQNKFDEKNVSSNMKVYAFMSDKLVTVNIKQKDGSICTVEKQTVAGLNTLEKAETVKADALNLTFDGFYTNEGYTTKFDIDSESTVLYARYAAKVEFFNGYENLKVELINPGEKVTAPNLANIKKDYMDKDDIVCVSNVDRKTPFNFNDTISEDTIVRINWKTPYLEYEKAENGNKVFCEGIGYTQMPTEDIEMVQSFKVISIPATVVIDEITYDVVGAEVYASETTALKQVIFAEGIEHIRGLSASISESKLEKVELPSTLKYLEESFNNTAAIAKDLKLPEGLLAVYDCFWNDYLAGVVNAERKGGYDFSIEIPESVENIVSVPNNLTYKGSRFFNEGNFVFDQNPETGKTLVGLTQSAVKNNNLSIPEGTQALQVGVLHDIHFDYLTLPQSVEKVSYNLEKSEHPNYVPKFTRLSVRSAVNTPEANPQNSGMSIYGYAVIPNLNDYKYIVFNNAQYPAEMNKYAFSDWTMVDNKSQLIPYDQLDRNPLVFVAKKPAGEAVNVKVTTINTMLGSVQEVNISGVTSGSTLTKEELLNKANLTEAKLGYKFNVTGIKQFGNEFDLSKAIDTNLYLEIEYVFAATGVTTKDDGNGNLIVTGFDQATAQDLGTNQDPEHSTYLIVIPNEINGKKVVAIGDGAFENNKKVAKVYVGNSIKTIGKRAFKNAKNLDFFSVSDGGLEVIGEEAFMYAGAIKDEKEKWIANPELTKVSGYKNLPSLFMQIPLGNLKNIEPCAFNTPAIRSFEPTEIDKDRTSIWCIWIPNIASLVEGQFYYINGGNSPMGIVKYTGTEKTMLNGAAGDKINIEYYANAAGYYEGESVYFGSAGDFEASSIVSVTVKTGAIALYYNARAGLCFAMVDKVETNAIVYLDDSYFELGPDGCNDLVLMNPAPKNGQDVLDPTFDCWLTKDVFIAQAKSKYVEGNIFEDGWYMGQDNTLNTFVDKVAYTTGQTPGM